MSDRPANGSGYIEPVFADIEAATRRLMAALDALEAAAERRRDADRDENELASRIQALGTDRSRLADELDGSLVKTRRLERTNREIAERLYVSVRTAQTHVQHILTKLGFTRRSQIASWWSRERATWTP